MTLKLKEYYALNTLQPHQPPPRILIFMLLRIYFSFFFFFCFLRFFGQGCPPPAPFKKTMLRACVSLCFMKLMDCNGCLRNTFEVVFWALLEKPEKLRLIIWGLLSYDNLFYSFLLNKSKGSQTRTHLLLLVKKNKITNNVSIITKKEKNPNKQQNTNNQNN